MTKTARKRLEKSEFYRETYNIVAVLNIAMARKEDDELVQALFSKWRLAQTALKHITGKHYDFSRTEVGNGIAFSVRNGEDRIMQGFYRCNAE